MDPRITQILVENTNDLDKAERLISEITNKPFLIHKSNGEVFIEFQDDGESTIQKE